MASSRATARRRATGIRAARRISAATAARLRSATAARVRAAAAAGVRPATAARLRAAPAIRPASPTALRPSSTAFPQQPYGAPQQGGTPAPEAPGMVLAEWWERLVGRFIDGILFGVVYFILGAIFGAIFVSQIVYNPNTGEFTGGGLLVLAAVCPADRRPPLRGLRRLHARPRRPDPRQEGHEDPARHGERREARPGHDHQARGHLPRYLRHRRAPRVHLDLRQPADLVARRRLLAGGGIFVLTDSVRRQALHDKWSGTIVVKAQP